MLLVLALSSHCPPAPSNFTAYPGFCVGTAAPNCAHHLDRVLCNKALADCFYDAEKNCTASPSCNSFSLRCSSTGARCTCSNVTVWQTFTLGGGATVENNGWLSYTRNAPTQPPTPSLPTPPPTPSLPTPPPTPTPCTNDLQCSLNGVCQSNGSCLCDTPWTGPSCAKLGFEPAPQGGMYGYGDPFVTTSWGGNAIYDNNTKLWQLFVTEIAGVGCGLHNWQGHSTVARATSTSVTGPYEKQDVALPVQAHNPQAIKLGEDWYIFHIGSATGSSTPAKACNETLPPNAFGVKRDSGTTSQASGNSGGSSGTSSTGQGQDQGQDHHRQQRRVHSGAEGSTIHKSSGSPSGPFAPVAGGHAVLCCVVLCVVYFS
jgi:hypothetical protein